MDDAITFLRPNYTDFKQPPQDIVTDYHLTIFIYRYLPSWIHIDLHYILVGNTVLACARQDNRVHLGIPHEKD